jgi:LacI family transcriptional regulator
VTNERPATLSEVAQLAGVSLTTASKAMNGGDRIAESTRRRVLRAARQLSYAPNLVAKSLASGRGSIIGVLLPDEMIHRIAMPVVIGAQAELEQRNFSAIIADATGAGSRLDELGVMLRQRGVDGLLVIGDRQASTPSISSTTEIPCVYVHGATTDHRDLVHVSDDFAGTIAIVEHLVGLGRTRIAHITGPQSAQAVTERARGLAHALATHDLRRAGSLHYCAWSQRSARQATRELLAEAPDVDAIVCGSDQIAAAVLDTVSAAGRKVPDDIAITGWDNWIIFAQETDPGLTTVDMELRHLGAAAVRDLFAIIGGARPGGGIRLHEPTIVVRGSTDPHHR